MSEKTFEELANELLDIADPKREVERINRPLTELEKLGITLLCVVFGDLNIHIDDLNKENFDSFTKKVLKETIKHKANTPNIVEISKSEYENYSACNCTCYEFFYDEMLDEFYDANGQGSTLYSTVGKYILSTTGWPDDKDVFYLYYPYFGAFFRAERLKVAHEIAMEMKGEFLDCKPCGKKEKKL